MPCGLGLCFLSSCDCLSPLGCLQVTELKGLANHVVVGSVSCETKDLFAALPQVVAVDINDLGTIKLSLEVIWRLVGLKGLGQGKGRFWSN